MPFDAILKLIKKYKTFIVCTHVNPDPDALSSQLAVALLLKSQGKKVFAFSEEAVPRRYLFLPGAKMIRKVDLNKPPAYDIAIVVDCGDFDRIGTVKKILDPAKPVINIDHHVTNDSFGSVNHVIPNASSTAEVIFELLEAVKFKFNKNLATLLYLGIMTDTGSFRYENTTSRTHEVVSRLLKFRLPVNKFYQRLYETVPLNDLQHFTKIVSAFRPSFNGQVICLELHRSTLRRFSEEFDLRDKIFRYLRAVKGVDVIVILTDHGKDKTRVNLRSQGKVNVAKLAAIFGGGGHSRASGCVIKGNIAKAREFIFNQLEKVLKRKS